MSTAMRELAGMTSTVAMNDNAAHPSVGCDRARAALASPLRRTGQVPAPSCRRWHTVRGERVLSSIVAVEHVGGAPTWRASATIWGSITAERRRIALLLTEHLLASVGQGSLSIESHGGTTIARKALTAAEARLLAREITRDRPTAAGRSTHG